MISNSSTYSDALGKPLVCDVCGQAAVVRVLARYLHGEPGFEDYCLRCADMHHHPSRIASNGERLTPGMLLILFGALCGLLAAFGDTLPGFSSLHSGFGYKQQLGVALAVSGVFFGALLRIDVLAIACTMLLLMSLTADLIALDRTPGIGWKQQTVIAAAWVIVVAGAFKCVVARFHARSRQRRP